MAKKRGQSGGSAAALVAVIGLLIILYIIFLPPDDRKALLDGPSTTDSGNNYRYNKTLLSEKPGRMDYLRFLKYEHPISPILLYKTSNTEEFKNANPFYVKNGVFDKKFYSINFNLANVENTEGVLLTFGAKKRDGRLTILLNNYTMYDAELDKYNADPISLPKENLRSNNVLEFYVDSVGWKFWSTHEYIIENLKVFGNVIDTSRQESSSIFVIDNIEKFNLAKVSIKFNPECVQEDNSILDVYINNHKLFSGVPDCGILNVQEFSPAYIEEGENQVNFRTLKGSYLVDRIVVNTELKEIRYPSYYFEVNQSVYNDVRDGKAIVELNLIFFDDGQDKQGELFVNGYRSSFSTKDAKFKKSLNSYVKDGNNGIKIIPSQSSLEIIEMLVTVRNI